jgi:hypothetical protein
VTGLDPAEGRSHLRMCGASQVGREASTEMKGFDVGGPVLTLKRAEVARRPGPQFGGWL